MQQTSTAGSPQPSAEPVRRAAVVVHGRPDRIGDAVERVERGAAAAGVELTEDSPDLAIVLGGDGTMLRALQRFLPRVPVIGVNFGRVGFLASMMPDDMEEGLERAFAGDYVVYELPTLDADVGGETVTAINDVVATSAILGRMGEVEWFVGGEEMGRVPADGVIASTPTGSTAYNLSNGGPVLMWGLDALTITFIAPHSLHARSGRRPARPPRGHPQRDPGHPARGDRRRPPLRRAPARRHAERPARRAAEPARDPPRMTTFVSRYHEAFALTRGFAALASGEMQAFGGGPVGTRRACFGGGHGLLFSVSRSVFGQAAPKANAEMGLLRRQSHAVPSRSCSAGFASRISS